MPSLVSGVYLISNDRQPVVLTLTNGSTTVGTRVVAWQKLAWKDATATPDTQVLSQLWLVKPVPNMADTFTLRNLMGGTYFSLPGANTTNGTDIVGGSINNAKEVQWIIKSPSNGQPGYLMQNAASKTFVDLYVGGTSNGTKISGWDGDWTGNASPNQTWTFDRVSRSGGEIKAAVLASPDITVDFKSFLADSDYLLLPQGFWQKIWNESGLKARRWRAEIFDCDDFATVFKAEAAKWGDATIKADNISILCGLMYGRNDNGAHAYNFTVMSDAPQKVIFFEPQTNTFMDRISYKAYFGMF